LFNSIFSNLLSLINFKVNAFSLIVNELLFRFITYNPKFIFIHSIVLFTLYSCHTQTEKYPGFAKNTFGVYFKLNAFGDGTRKISKDDNLKLTLVYKTENDSVFLTTHHQNLTGAVILSGAQVSAAGIFGNSLTTMNEGDSVTFIVEAANLFEYFFQAPLPIFLKENSIVKVEVKLNALLDKNELLTEFKKYSESANLWDVEEQRLIENYITFNKLTANQLPDGMYYIPLQKGIGAQADSGRTISINYKGYFLDGQKFDSTNDSLPFEFVIGEEFQIIWGLQQGIKKMREGEKAKFIIPSYLAFGENGSSTGLVPPYKTVMYEVELIKVK